MQAHGHPRSTSYPILALGHPWGAAPGTPKNTPQTRLIRSKSMPRGINKRVFRVPTVPKGRPKHNPKTPQKCPGGVETPSPPIVQYGPNCPEHQQIRPFTRQIILTKTFIFGLKTIQTSWGLFLMDRITS